VKPGTRALGIAESYREQTSTLAGAVVRADRVVDGLALGSCTVGGTDATDSIVDIYRRLNREDIGYLLVAGIAPAWFNVLDLHRLHEHVDRPVLSVSFEGSTGLESDISDAFDGEARTTRLDIYRRQPARQPVGVGDEQLFVRSVGAEDAATVARAFTPEGGRPEPVRVARLAARAGRTYREP